MIISEQDAVWGANEFIEYFSPFKNIEDYIRFVKKDDIKSLNTIIPLNEYFFNEDIHPEDMEFDIKFVGDRFRGISHEHYNTLLKVVSSHIHNSSRGRDLRWMVYEKNTQKVVGFIRFGSPIINLKPRHIWLTKKPNFSIFNRHAAMGFVIIPSQPFGYNYLGGKLLALLCCSHFARESLNTVFEKDIALFETTSLYGSTTDSCQYDGLKPFLRYKGLTESKFIPMIHNSVFNKLNDRFTVLNDNTPLTDKNGSSKKMTRQRYMISIIRKSLILCGQNEKLQEFNSVISSAFDITQKKRTYLCEYGYSNVREVILGQQTELVRGPNWDKFYLENIIAYWKNKATKRYEKLKGENRLRTKVELWSDDDEIQIIR